mgnify:CR=1 FL=1
MKKFIDWITSSKSDFVLLIIVLVLLNLVGANAFFRLDLTSPKSYSLSQSSKEVVKNLEEPLSVKVFFSENINKIIKFISTYQDNLLENVLNIPELIVPGKTSTMRCCVYKERAILSERVKMVMGGDKNNPNVIEVIDIACDECPSAGYEVTDSCRGCLAHRCEDVCKKGAIWFQVFLPIFAFSTFFYIFRVLKN